MSKPKRSEQSPDRDERVALPLDPETALKALLAVEPDNEASGDNTSTESG